MTQQKWRYFTVDGKRKKDLKIVRFTGKMAAALINESAFITTVYDKAKG